MVMIIFCEPFFEPFKYGNKRLKWVHGHHASSKFGQSTNTLKYLKSCLSGLKIHTSSITSASLLLRFSSSMAKFFFSS